MELTPKKIFDEYYCRASKRFGQNFLFNESINRKIINSAGELSGKIIAEIGPGPGGLTLEILKQDIKKLYIIEYDKHWADTWKQLSVHFDDKLQVIECDALKFNMKTVAPQIIISNLPYNISTQLLFKWLPDFSLYEKLLLMFQKEVADRICAKEKTKAYGKLSVLSQWKSKVSKKFDLEPGCFSPPPKVKSTVLEFSPFSQFQLEEKNIDFQDFSDFLTDVFAQRRKIVAKSMSKYTNNPIDVLEMFGYSSLARAEDISVSDYLKIFQQLHSSD